MWKELENQPEANPSVFSAAPYNFAHCCSQPLCFLNMKKLPCMPLLPSTLQFLKTLGSGCPSGHWTKRLKSSYIELEKEVMALGGI